MQIHSPSKRNWSKFQKKNDVWELDDLTLTIKKKLEFYMVKYIEIHQLPIELIIVSLWNISSTGLMLMIICVKILINSILKKKLFSSLLELNSGSKKLI